MAINGFKPKDKLYGSTNFNSWKARLTAILEENDLDDIAFNVIEDPTSNAGRLAYKRKQAKVRRIFYDRIINDSSSLTLLPLVGKPTNI